MLFFFGFLVITNELGAPLVAGHFYSLGAKSYSYLWNAAEALLLINRVRCSLLKQQQRIPCLVAKMVKCSCKLQRIQPCHDCFKSHSAPVLALLIPFAGAKSAPRRSRSFSILFSLILLLSLLSLDVLNLILSLTQGLSSDELCTTKTRLILLQTI